MELLDQYFKLQQEIYTHFGYQEDWVVIPLDDRTSVYWHLTEFDVHWSKSRDNLVKLIAADFDYDLPGIDEQDYYSNEIYTQRFLPKWVYEASDYTMVCVDTQTDNNKFLAVYDNKKRVR